MSAVEDGEVTVNTLEGALYVPHIGISLRTLLAVASDNYKFTRRRTWKVIYANTVIGNVRIKDTHLKGIL